MKIHSMIAFCRACQSRIQFSERPDLYDIVSCPECEETFEVVNLSPIRLDWPAELGDDETWSNTEFDGELSAEKRPRRANS